ncbi:MAG: hypothetical protein JNL43_06155 [Flavobacteriales bacterium]|nr:hypothetical protein [Flavobacteriales bacterium]
MNLNSGILFAVSAALFLSTSVSSCKRTADPRRIATVDSLINAVEAVRLTLNELDTDRYEDAQAIFRSRSALFLERFNDTLDKPTAAILGEQFVQLRESAHRAADHRMMLDVAQRTVIRLKELQQDMVHVALPEEGTRMALVQETAVVEGIENGVMQVIANYQANQRVLEHQASVDSLLADTLPERRTR